MNTITNGNGTPTFEPNLVPIFEPNQVLKNTDLNSIVTYLDSHNRLTRTHLIGMGIVCGLAVQSSTALDEIRITAGCGITSEGFFVQYLPLFDTANVDRYRFTHYREESLNKDRLIPSESKDQQYLLQELITAKTASDQSGDTKIHPLTNLAKLDEKVVLILCDWEDRVRDSCLVDCDDRGRDRNFSLRFFLIDKSASSDPNILSAEKLLRAGFAVDAGQTLDSAFQGWFSVPECHIDRLGYPTQSGRQVVDLSEILNFDDLMRAYYRVCKAGILLIDKALQQTHTLFSPFISTFHPTNAALDNLKNRLKEILIGLVPVAIANADPFPDDVPPYVPSQPQVGYGIQYFHDYLVELVAAFNELKDALFDLMDACMPDMGRFPKYLLAGEVSPPTADCPRPSLYRHSFYQPPIYNGNQQRKQEVRHLYERLVRISEGFNFLPFYQTPVKITPSRTRQALLGEQAIPYYYNYSNIYPYWNYDACRKQRAAHLPAYFRLNGLSNQRGYDLIPRIDWSDFCRIEGHVGLPLMEAIARIEGYKQDFNLAFDLVVVRLGEGVDEPELLEGYFDDLEVEFDRIKASWQKKYEYAKQTISNRQINQILDKFNELFFKHEDLAKIDPGLMENEFLNQARDPENYEFELLNPTANHYRLVLNFRTTPARIALVTDETLTGTQIQRVKVFTFADADYRNQNWQRIKETFANNFSAYPSHFQVEVDNDVYRFVLKDGQENIELVGTDADLTNLVLRLEDETPYNANGLIDRYHDFDALFTFLKYFGESGEGERDAILSAEDAAILVSYYEFRALFRRYLLRLEAVKKLQLFQEYAKQHRGLEHLGGVPKGGTLALVYTSDSTVINNLIASDSALISVSDQQVSAIKTKAQFPDGRLKERDRTKAISSDRIGQNVVIADFCLPYLCCSAYSSLNYVMAQPKPLIALPQSVYCEDDNKIYDFILDPPGGLLRGGDGIVDHNGNYAFQPSAVDADITEPMNLTFFYIVDGVASSVSVLMLPVADVSLSIINGKGSYCVSPEGQLIQFNATPSGGQFRLAINDAPDQPISVDQNNRFDLATIPFPDGQNSLTAQFTYTVSSTDDYCGNTSAPLAIILVRQPQARIGYDRNEAGQAIGTLVYGSDDCTDMRLRVDFRDEGSEAETYEWQLNNQKVADTRDTTLEISYKLNKREVTLIARNQHPDSRTTCSHTDNVDVILPPLNPEWKFDADLPTQPEDPETIVLCRNGDRKVNQEPLTVQQPGGIFSSEPGGLTVSFSNTDLPCEQRTGYVLDFANARPGIYSLTYTLPDGSQFSRRVEIAAVPIGSFDLNVRILPDSEPEAFEISFTNIQPRRGQQSLLRYQWEITIGDRDPISTEKLSTVLPYGGDLKIRPGEPISVVMRLSNSSGICATVSEPKTSQIPMVITRLEFYQAFFRGNNDINWELLTLEDNTVAVVGLGEANLNIRAITFPREVGSVVFKLQVPEEQRAPDTSPDNRFPYDLYRNLDDDTQATGWRPRAGRFTLTAIPYSEMDGRGNSGDEKQVTFFLRPGID